MREWFRRFNPQYESRKSDVELLALSTVNGIEANWAIANADRRTTEFAADLGVSGYATSEYPQYCNVSYEVVLPGSGKVPLWQIQALDKRVRAILEQRDEIGLHGYRFVYNEPKRTLSFYAECAWRQ